ncbi:MAG TPA: VCBS repeat-containing protein, partial [Puia sp.]|nr:VCBS repeat-containing protein [Puia sp.]
MFLYHRKSILVVNFFLACFFLLQFFVSCKSKEDDGLDDYGAKGKLLAHQYCQSCHLFPEPNLADKKSWTDGILPQMGPRLGIFRYNASTYPSSRYDINIIGKNYYPNHPMMKDEDWGAILTYYAEAAPDSMPPQKRSLPISPSTPLFQPLAPAMKYANPVTTFLSVDTIASPHRVLQSDGLKHALYMYNDHLNLTDSTVFYGTLLDVIVKKDTMLFCNVGIINPNDGRFGTVELIANSQKKDHQKITYRGSAPRIADSLRRPVQIVEADLNKDGRKDLIVCEFGNLFGSLTWYENTGAAYKRHVLRAEPGSINAIVDDYNHDGLPDIWALFSQGDESIVLFTNKGNGVFEQEQVLRFPSIYGSSHFELNDFNGDGYPDILYTCGDNADYSQVLKPYHGVYIFLNDGKNHFSQKFFYPIHGCYKAIARDFDGDGDLDIATISFFADYAHDPSEGFVYFENKGNWNFVPSTLPETASGRWLTMA